jgi:hypothetical protein
VFQPNVLIIYGVSTESLRVSTESLHVSTESLAIKNNNTKAFNGVKNKLPHSDSSYIYKIIDTADNHINIRSSYI